MTGRVVLVTGASSGIGRAAAHEAAADGALLTLAARGPKELEAAADECRAAGATSVVCRPMDVGDDAAVAELFRDIIVRHGVLDAVLHCAGVVAYGRTEDVPVEVFDAVLRTNLLGSVNVSRHAIVTFRTQQQGALVLIGSVIGHIAVPSMSPYVLSKWGVRALARQLQVENRDLRDVSISYVAPGGVDTPIYEQAANYQGFVGRPPPPVASPGRVGRAAWKRVTSPRRRTQVGPSNYVIRAGFTVLPRIFDALVGPLFALAATDRTTPVAPGDGNVMRSQEAGNGLRGTQGSPVAGIARNVSTLVRSARGRRRAGST